MSERDHYPPGVPCWVDTGQPDADDALRFYAALFEWEYEGPGPMPGEPPGRYYVARVGGRDVAGISTRPPDAAGPVAWNTYVSVDGVDDAARRAAVSGGTVLAAPFDAAPAGRIAVLADPSGAVICAWEPGDRQGAQRINEPSAWAMSRLNTTDVDSARAFYGAVFGWKPETFSSGEATVTLFRLPGYVGGEPQQPVPRDCVAVMMGAPPGVPAHWSVDFWTDDTDTAVRRTIEHGGAVVAAPFDVQMFRTAVLQDPQGAMFTISQLMLGAAGAG